MDAEQNAQQAVISISPTDARIKGLLYQRARDRAISLRWNVNALMFVYAILITVIILTMQNVNGLIVAAVAVLGLVVIWLFSSLQAQRLEKKFYQEEVQNYTELATSEPRPKSDSGEPSASVGLAESPLTPREFDILVQLAMGKVNKEIAGALGISAMTVKNHISHILEKLDVDDRTSAVLLAIRRGWIKLDEIWSSKVNQSKWTE
jgi:DNA-binding CsgD family transcriptional regulator